MGTVISFPAKPAPEPKMHRVRGAQTLFLHIKSTTMIVHLGAPKMAQTAGGMAGKTKRT